jgi:hypothetical protein
VIVVKGALKQAAVTVSTEEEVINVIMIWIILRIID